MALIRVLVFPVDTAKPIRDTWVDDDLASLQQLVGGYIESMDAADWHIYINEDGNPLGLPENHRAMLLARMSQIGWRIVGDCVVLGHKGGEEVDVPRHVIELALTLFGRAAVKLEPKP